MSIKVFGFRENPLKDRSTFHVSKSTRDKWLTLGTHIEIDRHTIQAVDPSKKRAIRHTVAYKSFVPEKLPPVELPGVRFVPPTPPCLTPIYSES
jgi:hypothetical protein